jgi:diguanylate cyclase (GGDEF)-like protein/PAS domain S-box-containing protein
MLGYSPQEWARTRDLFVTLLHPDDRERVLAAHRRVHATGEPLYLEYRLRSRNGRYVWVHDEARVIRDPESGEPALQGYLLDVTARKEAEEQLRHQAFHDPLTGLPNRALFLDRLEHALELRAEHGGDVAVLFLDLDELKAVNDGLGHLAGDTLLRLVGERLRAALSPGDTISRLGGDEFAILVETAESPHEVVDVAERLVTSLQDPFVLAERQVYVTASIGITIGDDVEGLLRSADLAMYRAKSAGKAQYAVYAPWMDADVGALELVAELRRASIEKEFVLQYQPEVELATGAIVGLEALVRWRHPTRGLLPPSEFVQLAEETGRIVAIGRWVLGEASRQLAEWRAAFPAARDLSVSVNVSPRQVRGPGLVEDVRDALDGAGLPPQALVLEITESVLAQRRDEMRRVLDDIVGLGVRLALDDFGTGYSSLALLQDLPVHMLKIDRSFVHELESTPERRAFVRAIIDLARALGLGVVAEGIEDDAQARILALLGCPHGQGFHYAAPLDPDEVARLLSTGMDAGLAKRGDTRAA